MKLQLTLLALAALAAPALSQRIFTLAEREDHTDFAGLFTATETKTWSVQAWFPNFHKVEGEPYSYYDGLDGSLAFKARADNSWLYSHTQSVYAQEGQYVNAWHYYYSIDETHPQHPGNGVEYVQDPINSSYHSRTLREKVTDHVNAYAAWGP